MALQSTPTCIWQERETDQLGYGATSTVYKGILKTGCHLVAVKVFNNHGIRHRIHLREVEIMKELKQHNNVVQLLSVEACKLTKQDVIIMEYCSGGSLYNMLQQPEYMYGVEDEEFRSILIDVVEGVKHLRNKGIYHRDIKPGNILISPNKQGRNVYKLSDFGEAKHLASDEDEFRSIHGTEEYVHPDIYGAAFMHQSNQCLTSSVDLWSLGVTIYHIATGALPFRPYGGRTNKLTMHAIITKIKGDKMAISGVQRESKTSPVKYTNELPEECRISQGFKPAITTLLRGLLLQTSEAWTFEQLFDYVDTMRDMTVVNVFTPSQSPFKVYIPKKIKCIDTFQKEIAHVTKIPPQHQSFYWDRDEYSLPDSCDKLPRNTPAEKPLVILSPCLSDHFITRQQPTLPHIEDKELNLITDKNVSKCTLAILLFYLSIFESFILIRNLMLDNVKTLLTGLKRDLAAVERDLLKLKAEVVGVEYCVRPTIKLKFREALRVNFLDLEETYKFLRDERDSLAKYWNELTSESHWHDCTTNCLAECRTCAETVREIFQKFSDDCKKTPFQYNDEQLHRVTRVELRQLCKQFVQMYENHGKETTLSRFKDHEKWRARYLEYKTRLESLDGSIMELTCQYKAYMERLKKMTEKQICVPRALKECAEAIRISTPPSLPTLPLEIEESRRLLEQTKNSH